MIDGLKGSHAVNTLCHAFGVHRSSFRYWLAHSRHEWPLSPALVAEIQHCFTLSNGSAGARSLAAMVSAAGIPLTRYRAAKVMSKLNLKSCQPPRAINKNRGNAHAIADNILNRAFDPCSPNRVWCTDVTYIWTGEQWSYLAVVLDLYSRRPVGWSLSNSPDTALTLKALERAYEARGRPQNIMIHSDQGCHFTSKAYRQRLKRYGMAHSMSRRRNCWDNAPMERFFRSLKSEWMPQAGWSTSLEAKHAINHYIYRYYNLYRPHQHNEGLSPMEKEDIYFKKL